MDLVYDYDMELIFCFFRSPTVVKNLLDASTTWADALAGIGGTLGGFMGFSFLSFIEILYWIVGFFIWKQDKKNETKEEQLPSVESGMFEA